MTTRVFKTSGPLPRSLEIVERDEMEDFPADEELVYELPLPPEEQPEVEEEGPVDLDALREAVLAEARAEAKQKVHEAYTEGYERGQEAGEAAFRESIAHAAEALEQAAGAIRDARQAFLDGLEPQVLELTKLIAERVVHREARTDPDLILTTVRRGLERIADQGRLRVRVHPGDLEALEKHNVTLLDEIPGLEELIVEADDGISPGGCIVDSELMCVDARLENLLADALEQLAD